MNIEIVNFIQQIKNKNSFGNSKIYCLFDFSFMKDFKLVNLIPTVQGWIILVLATFYYMFCEYFAMLMLICFDMLWV